MGTAGPTLDGACIRPVGHCWTVLGPSMVGIRPVGQGRPPGFLFIVYKSVPRLAGQRCPCNRCSLTIPGKWNWVVCFGFGWTPVGVDNVGHRQPRHASGPIGQERPPASLLSHLPIIRAALSAGFQIGERPRFRTYQVASVSFFSLISTALRGCAYCAEVYHLLTSCPTFQLSGLLCRQVSSW